MIRKLLDAVRPAWLSVAGLGTLASAVWVTFGLGAGLAAIGVAFLILEWRITS